MRGERVLSSAVRVIKLKPSKGLSEGYCYSDFRTKSFSCFTLLLTCTFDDNSFIFTYIQMFKKHLIKQNFSAKIINIFLPIISNICFGCSKEPSH